MNEIVSLIHEYRQEWDLDRRYEIANWIYGKIVGPLKLFIFGLVPPSAVEEVLNETTKAIIINLEKFQGEVDEQFFAWCYRIARNKAKDYHRGQFNNRLDTFPLDEIRELVELTNSKEGPVPPEIIMDLEYAMNMLAKSKPKCRELLWNHYIIGMRYTEIGEDLNLKYDAVRMKVERCLETARKLLGD
jgi:RNA polymerase sigma factor (sigma-70 family)